MWHSPKSRSNPISILLLLAVTAIAPPGRAAEARTLTFEQRVAAQESISRIYYSHLIGSSRSFTETMPLASIEAKVHRYLALSAALEEYWGVRLSASMVETELRRIEANTQMPGRLREIYTALGNDSFLIQECFVRPVLTERLARHYYAQSEALHQGQRDRAIQAWNALMALAQGNDAPETLLPKFELQTVDYLRDQTRAEGGMDDADPPGSTSRTVLLPSEDFDRFRAETLGRRPENVTYREEATGFQVTLARELDPDHLRIWFFELPKRSYSSWWSEVETRFPNAASTPVSGNASLDLEGPNFAGKVVPPSVGDLCIGEDTWQSFPYRPPARAEHTAVWTGTEMIVWGGRYFRRGCDARGGGERYDPVTDRWAAIYGGPLEGRTFHSAVWTGTEMILWGGNDSFSTFYDDGAAYNPATDDWRLLPTTGAPTPRQHHTAVWTGQEMLIWGGDRRSSQLLNTGGAYDPASNTWRDISTADAPSPRTGHTAVWTGSTMLVWGGSSDPGAEYDPVEDRWTPIPVEGQPAGSRRHSAVWTGSEMIVWGGEDDGAPTDSGARYAPGWGWSPLSMAGAPTPRSGHTAVWDGSRMIVWGGADRTGGIYDPGADAWTGISVAGAPTATVDHAAVWTGQLMVVWGGGGPCTVDESGGRYDPEANAWLPIGAASNPLGRRDHTAVWTGNEMIIWGGQNYIYGSTGELRRDGGRYDPVTATWLRTSMQGAPSARYLHNAVWTGEVMIVWGFGSTGGRYDPATDTWLPTSTEGDPGPRVSSSAIWTGDVMVVWGGYPGYLSTGGRYDPVADTWLPTSIAGAPGGRARHSAVWAEDRMVIWGGESAYGTGGLMKTGGSYDPVTDTWWPMSTSGAPVARRDHAAVWTGSEMLVWGGDSGVPEATGGAYDPATDGWRTIASAGVTGGPRTVWTGQLMVAWPGGRYDPEADAWQSISTAGAPGKEGTAVWADEVMIVWGGSDAPDGGRGLYAPTGTAGTADADSDGFSVCAGDCDDGDATVNPGAIEIPGNDVDEDCDGNLECDPGAGWKNHGRFVRCVARECEALVLAGIRSREDCHGLVSEAARSGVGRQ